MARTNWHIGADSVVRVELRALSGRLTIEHAAGQICSLANSKLNVFAKSPQDVTVFCLNKLHIK
ncbi:hypothetical protein OnM2_050032 [Erysiphe neolycopersici]|uniref:Uncharacterized protein n=1 Tax=Erysiphe neolycopersici TaxID=212602 RepID=A0A420HST0_9PEZI|nr:hypothetical protein OnM2_050032 [Erysiphe neolycopersici]